MVFSKSMSCKYFRVRSNPGLIGFEYCLGKNVPANLFGCSTYNCIKNLDT